MLGGNCVVGTCMILSGAEISAGLRWTDLGMVPIGIMAQSIGSLSMWFEGQVQSDGWRMESIRTS